MTMVICYASALYFSLPHILYVIPRVSSARLSLSSYYVTSFSCEIAFSGILQMINYRPFRRHPITKAQRKRNRSTTCHIPWLRSDIHSLVFCFQCRYINEAPVSTEGHKPALCTLRNCLDKIWHAVTENVCKMFSSFGHKKVNDQNLPRCCDSLCSSQQQLIFKSAWSVTWNVCVQLFTSITRNALEFLKNIRVVECYNDLR